MSPVGSKIDKNCRQIPHKYRIPWKIKQAVIVVHVNVGHVLKSWHEEAGIELGVMLNADIVFEKKINLKKLYCRSTGYTPY